MGSRLEYPKFQALDNNGDFLSGGWLFSYYPGTDTAKALYQDAECTTPHTNPIILNSRGETAGSSAIYCDGAYKILLTYTGTIEDEVYTPGVTIWTMDNVYGGGGGGGDGSALFLSDFGCDLASAVSDISSDEVSLWIDCDGAVAVDLVVPYNVNLRWIKGNLVTVASGKTLTINSLADMGKFQYFAGTGTVLFGGNAVSVTYPEWFGAVGDQATDDTAAINKAITAAPHSTMVLLSSGTGYKIVAETAGTKKAISLPRTKSIHLSGGQGCTILAEVDANDCTALDIILSNTTYKIRPKISGLRITRQVMLDGSPDTTTPADFVGTGIYIEGCTSLTFDNCKVDGFNKNWELYNNTWFTAMNRFYKCDSYAANYCWYLSTLGGLSTLRPSMGTNHWIDCIAYTDVDSGICFYQGPGVNLYRSSFQMTCFPHGTDAIGFYFDGKILNADGLLSCEAQSDASGKTGNIGIYFGPNMTAAAVRFICHITGCADGCFVKDPLCTRIPKGFYLMSNKGRTEILWDGQATQTRALRDAGYATSKAIEAMTATNPIRITITGHGMADGDEVECSKIEQADWMELNWDSYPITLVDADTFTVDFDASGFLVPYDKDADPGICRFGIYRMTESVQSDGSVEIGLSDYLKYENRYTGLFADVKLSLLMDQLTIDETETIPTTPNVTGLNVLNLEYAAPVSITDFLGGVEGKMLFVLHHNANATIIQNDDYIRLIGGKDFVPTTQTRQLFIFNSRHGAWEEVSRGLRLPSEETLLSATTVPLNADTGLTPITLYTVPYLARLVLSKAVLVSGGDAGGSTTITIGRSTALADFVGTRTLSNLNAAYDVVELKPINAEPPPTQKSYAANVIIQAVIAANSGDAGSANSVLYLYGHLY